MEPLVTLHNDAIYLAGRDIDPQFPELLKNQRLSNMTMVVLVENETLQRGTEVAAKDPDLLRKLRHYVIPLGSFPPLPSVDCIVWLQQEILNRKILIPLQYTPRWDVSGFDNQCLMDLKLFRLVPLRRARTLCAAPPFSLLPYPCPGQKV